MTGRRALDVSLTVAQWDTLLAALEYAETGWRSAADLGGPHADTFRRSVSTLLRARSALGSAWDDRVGHAYEDPPPPESTR